MATGSPLTVQELLARLRPPERGNGGLAPAAERAAIPEAVSQAKPTAAQPGGGSGVVSPLVEQAYAGSTFLTMTSSDGLFVFEYGDETDYIDNGGIGNTYTFQHL